MLNGEAVEMAGCVDTALMFTFYDHTPKARIYNVKRTFRFTPLGLASCFESLVIQHHVNGFLRNPHRVVQHDIKRTHTMFWDDRNMHLVQQLLRTLFECNLLTPTTVFIPRERPEMQWTTGADTTQRFTVQAKPSMLRRQARDHPWHEKLCRLRQLRQLFAHVKAACDEFDNDWREMRAESPERLRGLKAASRSWHRRRLCTREGEALVVDKVTVTSSTQNPEHGGGYRIALLSAYVEPP